MIACARASCVGDWVRGCLFVVVGVGVGVNVGVEVEMGVRWRGFADGGPLVPAWGQSTSLPSPMPRTPFATLAPRYRAPSP